RQRRSRGYRRVRKGVFPSCLRRSEETAKVRFFKGWHNKAGRSRPGRKDLEAFTKYLVHEVVLIAVVEAESEFVKVEWQVLLRDLVEDAHDSAFEQRPHVFDSVGVDVPWSNVGLSMVDGLVRELRRIKPQVRLELVGVDFRS